MYFAKASGGGGGRRGRSVGGGATRRRGVDDRPRVDEQRRIALLEAGEQRAQALDPGGVGERSGGQGDADAAAIEGGVDGGGVRVRLGDRHRPPAAELDRQFFQARVVGLDQRRRLCGRQRLDPERGREGDQGPVDPVGLKVGTPQLGVGRLEREDAVGLAREPEGPSLTAGDQPRRRAPTCQRLDQGLPQEVLVYVDRVLVSTRDGHCWLSLSRLSIKVCA